MGVFGNRDPSGGGAGIGSGAFNFEGGSVHITGGNITAIGGEIGYKSEETNYIKDGGAGIGSGSHNNTYDDIDTTKISTDITIDGGTIHAYGGNGGAGIGGGTGTIAGIIVINDGAVFATGGSGIPSAGSGSGIGDGYAPRNGAGQHITINGGTITATSDESGDLQGTIGAARGASIGTGGYLENEIFVWKGTVIIGTNMGYVDGTKAIKNDTYTSGKGAGNDVDFVGIYGKVKENISANSISSVSVTAPETVTPGEEIMLTAQVQVNGSYDPHQGVWWELEGATSTDTTINQSGILKVATDEGAGSITVTATSDSNSGKSARKVIQIEELETHNVKIVSDVAFGSTFSDKAYQASTEVSITPVAKSPYNFDTYSITDKNGDVVPSEYDGGVITFIMPNSAVEVQLYYGWASFAKKPTGGIGAPSDPYQISTPEELAWVALQINSGAVSTVNAKLINNIVLIGHEWTPIGSYDATNGAERIYSGTFDGNGYTISGMVVNSNEGSKYLGLFGQIEGATIQNVNVVGSITHRYFNTGDYEYVGGIAAYADATYSQVNSILNCSYSGSIVSNEYAYVGGIVGKMKHSGEIINCASGADIQSKNGADSVGGILGAHERYNVLEGVSFQTHIVNSVNTGDIEVDIGIRAGDAGAVNSRTFTGGIVGKIDKDGFVVNCYNSGDIVGYQNYVGMLAGYVNYSAVIEYNYHLYSSNNTPFGIMASNYGNSIGIYSPNTVVELYASSSADDAINLESVVHALNTGVAQLNTYGLRTSFEYAQQKKTLSPPAHHWAFDESGNVVLTDRVILGDINGSGTADAEDLQKIAEPSVYNKSLGDLSEDKQIFDLNGDDVVNFADLAIARNSRNFEE